MQDFTWDDDSYDNGYMVERFNRKPSFKDESYRKERKNSSIRRKRQQKEREREQMRKMSEMEDGGMA